MHIFIFSLSKSKSQSWKLPLNNEKSGSSTVVEYFMCSVLSYWFWNCFDCLAIHYAAQMIGGLILLTVINMVCIHYCMPGTVLMEEDYHIFQKFFIVYE